MARRTTSFKPIPEYLPESSSLTIEEAYKEYTRLRRNVGLKRIKALKEFDTPEYREYQWIQDKPASAIAPNEIRNALLDMYKFTVSRRTTVEGAKRYLKQAEERMARAGYKIPKERYADFRDFLDRVSTRFKGHRSSDLAAEVFSEMTARGLTESQANRDELVRNFDWYLGHMDMLTSKRTKEGKLKATSLKSLRKALEGK